MKKIIAWLKAHKPTKRRIIQLYAALLFNANLKGFGKGRIYQGPLKYICTPGLNCYSCPGAAGSCPVGALQNAMAASDKRIPYYIFGIILLYGFLLGRWICGFLCPFGLIQELLHKIKTPKLKKNKVTRILSYFKYVVLVFFCIIIPLLYMLKDVPLPAFCKYICPAGTLGGAIGLLASPTNDVLFGMLGPLFTWKFMLMVSFLVGAVFIYRIFCRFLCPLGALYGLFNKISMFGVYLDKPKCTDCGKCITVCKMDIRHVGDAECISCGECMKVCPTQAITWKGSKPMLAPNEIEAATPEEAVQLAEEHNAKIKKRNKIIQIVAAVSMAVLLVGALVYYNFIDTVPESKPTIQTSPSGEDLPPYGNQAGNLCYEMDIPLLNGDKDAYSKTFNVKNNRGKVTVINFWYTSCTPCVGEMPHFNEIAKKYGDEVTVVALHADADGWVKESIDFVNSNWSDYKISFAYDTDNAYYELLGGMGAYPQTLVLDERGVIVAVHVGSVTYDALDKDIQKALGK